MPLLPSHIPRGGDAVRPSEQRANVWRDCTVPDVWPDSHHGAAACEQLREVIFGGTKGQVVHMNAPLNVERFQLGFPPLWEGLLAPLLHRLHAADWPLRK